MALETLVSPQDAIYPQRDRHCHGRYHANDNTGADRGNTGHDLGHGFLGKFACHYLGVVWALHPAKFHGIRNVDGWA